MTPLEHAERALSKFEVFTASDGLPSIRFRSDRSDKETAVAVLTAAVGAADLVWTIHRAVCGDPWADCEDAGETSICGAAARAVTDKMLEGA